MKLKQLLGIATICMVLFAIHACSSDYTISEEDENFIKTTKQVKSKDWCKYTVTEGGTTGLTTKDIVCFPCVNSCPKSVSNKAYTKVVQSSTGMDSTITLGYVSGNNSTGKCANCPTGGKKSSS